MITSDHESHEKDATPVEVPAPSPDAALDDVARLLARMRNGDREAAAVFLTRYGSRIRRRIRGKLTPSMRRIFDSQEILSTLGRRLDMYVRDARLEAADEGQLWALVLRMASNAVVDKARVFRRLESAEEEDGPFARELLRRMRDGELRGADGGEIELERALGKVEEGTDRTILTLWLADHGQAEIGQIIGMSAAAVRQRWKTIRATLRSELEKDEQRGVREARS